MKNSILALLLMLPILCFNTINKPVQAGGPAFRQHNHESGCPILARSLRKGGWQTVRIMGLLIFTGAGPLFQISTTEAAPPLRFLQGWVQRRNVEAPSRASAKQTSYAASGRGIPP